MSRQFGRYTPDAREFDLAEHNRLIDAVARRGSAQSVGLPMSDTSAGTGGWLPPDLMRYFLIQISAVTTVVSGTVPVVPAYDWSEVVRLNGVYVPVGDGRSGSAANFPAFDTNMSATVALNNGSTTTAYLAWLAWDEKSIEFVGKDAATGSSGGAVFSGAKLQISSGRDFNWPNDFTVPPNTYVDFDLVAFDVAGYSATRPYLTIPSDGYYLVGFETRPSLQPGGGLLFCDIRTSAGVILEEFQSPLSDPNNSSIQFSTVMNLTAGLKIGLVFWGSTPGQVVRIAALGPPLQNNFWITRLGS